MDEIGKALLWLVVCVALSVVPKLLAKLAVYLHAKFQLRAGHTLSDTWVWKLCVIWPASLLTYLFIVIGCFGFLMILRSWG